MRVPSVCILFSVISISSAILEPGVCPRVYPVRIDRDNFGGRWFEVKRARSFQEPSETNEKCNFDEYLFLSGFTDQGWRLRINSTAMINGKFESQVTEAFEPSRNGQENTASFVLNGPRGNELLAPQDPNFYVLHTSEMFSILYFCQEIGHLKVQLAWVMSRVQRPNYDDVKLMEDKLRILGIDLEMVNVNHEDCPELEDGLRNKVRQLRWQSTDEDSFELWRFATLEGSSLLDLLEYFANNEIEN